MTTFAFPKATVFRDKVVSESDGGDKVGKTSKLRLTHAMSELLIANRKHKATDEELAEILEAEFPKRVKAGEKSDAQRPRTLQSIAAYRAYFNAAKHGFNPDGKFGDSSSYNAEGVERAKPVPGGKGKAKKPAKGKGKASGKASKGKAAPKAKKATAA